MSIPNACMFVVVGASMAGLSTLPGVTGTREAWLVVMGGVMSLIGAASAARAVWARAEPALVAPLLAWAGRVREMDTEEAPEGRRSTV